ncbi:MAG: hypothetical protein ACD_2C00142G0002, partial [uncultured bacterium (gcode 4)]
MLNLANSYKIKFARCSTNFQSPLDFRA